MNELINELITRLFIVQPRLHRVCKIFRLEIWTFSFQICLWNQFWTLGSGKTENTQIHVFVYLCIYT